MNRNSTKHQRKTKNPFSLQSYLTFHGQAALNSLIQIIQTPLNTLLTIGVIAIALALPAGLFVLLENINSIGGNWEHGNQISLYLKMDTTTEAIDDLIKQLRARSDVGKVNLITPQQGLAEFEHESGFSSVLKNLPNNPLPNVIEVYPKSDVSVSEGAQHLFSELQHLPQVDIAKLDMQWLERLQSIVTLSQRIVIALSVFFAAAVLLIIGNTIRLATQQQRREIEVIKLIGATNSFIRRPFLYTGIYYGLLGGFFACVIIEFLLLWIEKPLEELFLHYHSTVNIVGLSVDYSFLVLFFGSTLGLCGSWLAVNRHIGKI